MALKLFNTLSRSVQEFTPLDPAGKTVGMYCCGPTVYDFAHIGNWRTFVFGDLARRYLEFKEFAVHHVMNVTDVEDKIIKRVRETRPTRIVEEAIQGMLPKTKLGKQMYRKLKVYAGDRHPHAAQKPAALTVK